MSWSDGPTYVVIGAWPPADTTALTHEHAVIVTSLALLFRPLVLSVSNSTAVEFDPVWSLQVEVHSSATQHFQPELDTFRHPPPPELFAALALSHPSASVVAAVWMCCRWWNIEHHVTIISNWYRHADVWYQHQKYCLVVSSYCIVYVL